MRSVLSATSRHDSAIGEGLEAVRPNPGGPFKDFTTPITVGSFAPDAECLVATSRHDSAIGEGLEAGDAR